MKGNVFMILAKIYNGTMRGLRFFIVQMFVWMAIYLASCVILLPGRGEFGGMYLMMSLQMCIFAYSMIFSLFYSLASFKHDSRSFFIPYILYASLVYLGIVEANNWNFKMVTIDDYMIMGWLAPLYGLGVLILQGKIKKKLHPYPRFLKIIKKTLNVFSFLFILVFILYIVMINFC